MTTLIFPTVAEFDAFIERLKNFDWYYSFSDDGSVYRSGVTGQKNLEEAAKANNYYTQAYKTWCQYISENIRGKVVEAALRADRDMVITALRDGLAFHHNFAPDADDVVFSKVPDDILAMQRPQ
jgi:hypothetical protein